MKYKMQNTKLIDFLKDFCEFLYWLLKQFLRMAVIGLLAVLYYQAGKSEMFESLTNTDEICEQRERELTNPANELVLEKSKVDKGVTSEK